MAIDTTKIARRITWKNSKQTYYIGRLMVDRHLVNDFYRAYAYLRWADDIIDEIDQTEADRGNFVTRQHKLIDEVFKGQMIADLQPEELILVDLVRNKSISESGLESFIKNVFAIIEFDARRKHRLITELELDWYIECLGKAVIDGLQYFIGSNYDYPDAANRHLASMAAHITHLLRDTVEDIANGFINIPKEYLDTHPLDLTDPSHPDFIAFVKERVSLAREYFREGKQYIDSLSVLRCKIVGHWYCLRFSFILKTIEQDGYILRSRYDGIQRYLLIGPMIWLLIVVPLSRLFSRIGQLAGITQRDRKTILD